VIVFARNVEQKLLITVVSPVRRNVAPNVAQNCSGKDLTITNFFYKKRTSRKRRDDTIIPDQRGFIHK
jgi:hypothetical protein